MSHKNSDMGKFMTETHLKNGEAIVCEPFPGQEMDECLRLAFDLSLKNKKRVNFTHGGTEVIIDAWSESK